MLPRRTHESSDSRVRVKRLRAIIDHPSNRRYQLRLSGQVVRAGINSGATRILFPPRLNAPCALPCGGGGGGDPSHNSQRSCCLGRTHTKTCSYYHIHLQPHPLQGSCLPPRYDVYLFVCLSISLSHSVCLSLLLFVRSSNVAVRLRQSIGLCVCQCAPLSVCFYLSRSLSLSHSLSLCRYAPMSVCSPLI